MNNPVLSNVFENDYMVNITDEFTRLKDHCYLDNTGAALYPRSLIKKVCDDYMNNIYMNPHSDVHSQERVEDVRRMILRHFNTDLSKYCVIFTSGATQSLKLVVESFRFNNHNCNTTNHGAFVHLRDNHTSILGLRELVKLKNIDTYYISHEDFLKATLSSSDTRKYKEENVKGNALLAYPAQNNFNGFKYPVNCINEIKNGCLIPYLDKNKRDINYNWHILLDVASFVSTNKLDLSEIQPDFLCLSFYKIFGYPTGLGALLVKNDKIQLLDQKLYYGGGTVDTVLNTENFYARKENVNERFEDGTISFLSIMALKHCFDTLNEIIPRAINNNVMDSISYHTYFLAKDLFDKLKEIRHENGRKAIQFYMDSDFTDVTKQGGIVTFNIQRQNGDYVGYNEFQEKAVVFKISIRTGCFCNSGSCQRHFKLTNKEIKDRYKAGHKCGGATDLIDGVPTGAIRASFGYYNTFADVDTIRDMIIICFVKDQMKLRNDTFMKSNSTENLQTLNYEKYIQEIKQHKSIPTKKITLKEIIIYPIQFCGPFKIKSSWNISTSGLQYNRKWKIVNANGTHLTEKQKALMSKISPEINLNSKQMILTMNGKDQVSVPLDGDSCAENNAYNNKLAGYDCSDQVATWISEAMNCSNLRLVRISTDEKNNKTIIGNNEIILLVNIASLSSHNVQMFESVLSVNDTSLTNTIKGNIIVDTSMELLDVRWDIVIIGDHEFKVERIFSQNYHMHSIESNRKFTKELLLGMYLTYIKSYTGSEMLKVNSHLIPILNDINYKHKYKEFKDKRSTSAHLSGTNNYFARKLKHLFVKTEKYIL